MWGFKPSPHRIVSCKKRFYTRGTLRGMRISRLAKIPPLYLELGKGLIILVTEKGRMGGD